MELVVKNPPANAGDVWDMYETWDVQSLGWEDSREEGMATHSSVSPGESHEQRRLAGYSPWGHKEWDMNEAVQHTHSERMCESERMEAVNHFWWSDITLFLKYF